MHPPRADDSRILPVILAGGIGQRLQPISTPERPKPFLPLEDGQSLLTHTARRIADPALFQPPLVIGREADRFALMNHLREAGVAPAAILLESVPKNTAAAVALALAWTLRRGLVHTTLAILPSDHRLAPLPLWLKTINAAARASTKQQKLVLLGTPARSPSPHYGYMLLGHKLGEGAAHEVLRFHEKPHDPAALTAQGALWNMGQFIAPAGLLAAHFKRHAPRIADAAHACLERSQQAWEYTLPAPYADNLLSTPFDRAVVEKSATLAVPFAGDWQDLGTLDAWKASTGLDEAYYATLPPRTDRPWGYFELLGQTATQVRKQLVIYPGCRLSRQRHQLRDEHWQILHGTAHIELGESIHRLHAGQSISIPAQHWHRLSNHHEEAIIIEEIQNGNPSEADIERDEDDYGRI